MLEDICPHCGHAIAWHINSDGPIKRPCNKPKCVCADLEA